MKKLLFILLVFSSQSFAQEYIEPNELPFGKKLEHLDTKSLRDTYIFYSNGLVHHSYYYDSSFDPDTEKFNSDVKYIRVNTAEGVWATHKAEYDTQIRIYLGSTQCTYQIKEIADTFIFSVAQNTTNSMSCSQKLLRIKKD
jgi:hypothetical protein